MTPKEKSSELLQKFTDTIFESGNTVSKPMIKEVAVICVKEIIATLKTAEPDYQNTTYWHPIDFYGQVLTELETI